MSEEEKTHVQLIEEIISSKVTPFYWIIGVPLGIILTIFITIVVPIYAKQMELTEKVEKKVDYEIVRSDFLTKGAYLLLQARSHDSDIEAIRNPSNADLIYNKQNNADAEVLDFISRGGISKN